MGKFVHAEWSGLGVKLEAKDTVDQGIETAVLDPPEESHEESEGKAVAISDYVSKSNAEGANNTEHVCSNRDFHVEVVTNFTE